MCVSTLDQAGNLHHGKGTPRGGQFTGRQNSAPKSTLDAGALPTFTREDACNPAFTFESLRAHLGDSSNLHEVDVTPDGHHIFEYTVPSGYRDFQHRIVVDEHGEVTGILHDYTNADGQTAWADGDHDGRDLNALRSRVNRDRLAMAGIYVHGADNDGGSYGNRFVGGRAQDDVRDAAVIAKLVRRDIKRAQEFGAIPENLDYRVTTSKFAGGQAIHVRVEGVKDEQQFQDRLDGFRGRHPWAAELESTLEVIGAQWQDQEIETQTDYFNVRYWFSVDIPDEHMTEFWRRGRQEAAAKRAAARA